MDSVYAENVLRCLKKKKKRGMSKMEGFMAWLTLFLLGLLGIGCYALYKWFIKKFGKYLP